MHFTLFIDLFFAMVVAHCLADYPLQGDFLAKAKNHRAPIAGVPWWIALTAHCTIHAGFVWAITGNILCGGLEFGYHFLIDWTKCNGEIDFLRDQEFHLAVKVLFAVLAIWMGTTGLVS